MPGAVLSIGYANILPLNCFLSHCTVLGKRLCFTQRLVGGEENIKLHCAGHLNLPSHETLPAVQAGIWHDSHFRNEKMS